MRKLRLPCLLILSTSMVVVHGFGAGDVRTCAENSVVASAIRTPEDVQAFVQCAYELVQKVGFEAARRAFHEEERWQSGPYYIFVDEMTPISEESRALVFPPDSSREGQQWGLLIDSFGNDLIREFHRLATTFGGGWTYYSFRNPATGYDEPKASYFKSHRLGRDSRRDRRRDLSPGQSPAPAGEKRSTPWALTSEPSIQKLTEFVRCAAMELESMGYFASVSLSSDPRWRRDSIYVFGVDGNGNTLFSGDPYRWGGWTLGGADSELTSLSDRDDLSIANAFGETFLYYETRNPATGMQQRKVVFVKRVVTYGLPILIGSGYYLADEE